MLSPPIKGYDMSLFLFTFSFLSFLSVLQFSTYRSYTCFVGFILKLTIFCELLKMLLKKKFQFGITDFWCFIEMIDFCPHLFLNKNILTNLPLQSISKAFSFIFMEITTLFTLRFHQFVQHISKLHNYNMSKQHKPAWKQTQPILGKCIQQSTRSKNSACPWKN